MGSTTIATAAVFFIIALSACNGAALKPVSFTNSSPKTTTAELACRTAVAEIAHRNLRDTSVVDVLTAEAGIGVTVALVGADNNWACLSDMDGNVQSASYIGEG